jgi:hypothetical protein
MSFFERPARPPARVARAMVASPPAWLGPPHNILPGVAPMELILARTDQTVAAITSIQAYPTGFDFTLSLRLRHRLRPRGPAAPALTWPHRRSRPTAR